MKESIFRHVFNLGAVIILTAVVLTALGYNRQSRLMPLIIAVPVLILALVHMILDFRKYLRERRGGKGRDTGVEKDGPGEGKSVVSSEIEVGLWVLGLFLFVYLFGHLAATLVVTFLSLKVRSRYPWGVSLAVACGSWAFLYVLIVRLLKADIYDGFVILYLRGVLFGY